MNGVFIILASPFLSAGIAASFLGLNRSRATLLLYWAAFAVSIFCFSLENAFGDRLGLLGPTIAIPASVTCGVSWCLARALFRPPGVREKWPLAVVGVMLVTSAFAVLVPGFHSADGMDNPALRIVRNINALTSSAVLVLILLEPVHGFNRDLAKHEKRFRVAFLGGYLTLITASQLWLRQSGQDTADLQMAEVIKVSCAVLALALGSWAVAFRTANPLPASAAPSKARVRPSAPADMAALQARIMRALDDSEFYKQPDAKVADLARIVGEPDYKVSQCITGAMGFQNFNRLVNHFRIACAKQMLADPQCDDRSILSIAMDCGFGSVGPFNRAFKEDAGVTPSQFRAETRRTNAPEA